MVLIFSDSGDTITNKVIDYLIFKNIEYLRFNEKERFNVIFDNNEIILIYGDIKVFFNKIKAVWYRRTILRLNDIKYNVVYLRIYPKGL
jgi:hypothetical protein